MTFTVTSGSICVLTTLWMGKKNKKKCSNLSLTPTSRAEESSAHRPLKRIQPANTRGQRWQAWRMRAALSSSSGSTCGREEDVQTFLFFCLPTRHRMLRHSHFLPSQSADADTETYIGGVDGPQAGEDVMELRGARLKVRQVLSPARCQHLLAAALQ